MSALLLWWLVKHCAKKRGIQKSLVEKWGLDILTVYWPCTCIRPCCLIGRAPQMVGCHWIIEFTYRVSQTSRTMYSFRNYYYGCTTLFHFLTDIPQTHKEYVWEEVVTNASQIHTNVDYGCLYVLIHVYSGEIYVPVESCIPPFGSREKSLIVTSPLWRTDAMESDLHFLVSCNHKHYTCGILWYEKLHYSICIEIEYLHNRLQQLL